MPWRVNERKPVVSVVVVMKSSVKTSMDTIKKFSRDRITKEDKARRASSGNQE